MTKKQQLLQRQSVLKGSSLNRGEKISLWSESGILYRIELQSNLQKLCHCGRSLTHTHNCLCQTSLCLILDMVVETAAALQCAA